VTWYEGGLRFRCARCGNCCAGKGSVVIVSRREREALANHLGLSIEEFEAQHTRSSLGETVLRDVPGGGDCEWLERNQDGTTSCRVNAAKPDQCGTYPFWPRILRDREAWETEGESCAGIGEGAPIPPAQIDARAGLEHFRASLETLLGELDAEISALAATCWISGNCCDFEAAGHRLYTSRAEAERFAKGVDLSGWDPESGLCPAWKDRRCTAREHRPLACRSYFCDPRTEEQTNAITERYTSALKSLHERHRVPWDYRDFRAHLAEIQRDAIVKHR
jgi:Fe-S-cluster containining protein